jgi:hypothetical protein
MLRFVLVAAFSLLLASPAFAKLEIEQIEACYGRLGPVRKTLDYYPNDSVCFRFTVKGAKADDDGGVDAEVAIVLLNDQGKEAYSRKAAAKGPVAFGSDSYPLSFGFTVPELIVAGEYTLKVKFKDKLAGDEIGFEKKLNVKATEFAIVAPEFFRDLNATVPASAGGVVGEQLHFRLVAIGLEHAGGKISTEMTAQVLDKTKKELMPKPLRIPSEIDDPKNEAQWCGFNGFFTLTKPGEFTLRLTVTDRNSKKTATWEAPLKVTAP